ncbi:hypothetical protein K474DRAFT_185554 [Panus rudis PR-1116 ss-1]|nr:hypothetical protein K474DRAFT_185554 [Panus rudis PR-1116 ss-1]
MQLTLIFLASLTLLSTFLLAPTPSHASPTPIQIAAPLKRMTNAERLSRGLPPNAPVFKRLQPGQHQNQDRDAPTRVLAARASPSSVPPNRPVSLSGRIQVRTVEGNSVGYVRNWESGIFSTLPTDQLHVQFNTTASGKGPFDIIATNPNFPAPFYVGAKSGSLDFGRGNSNYASLSDVEKKPFGPGLSQSALWSLDPSTKQLIPHWVNSDHRTVRTQIGVDLRNNYLAFTGDVQAFNKANFWPISEVQFFLVPV